MTGGRKRRRIHRATLAVVIGAGLSFCATSHHRPPTIGPPNPRGQNASNSTVRIVYGGRCPGITFETTDPVQDYWGYAT